MESEKFQSIQDFLLVYSYSVLSPSYDRQEQVRGIEPPSSAWKADILAIVRHLHVSLPSFGDQVNLGCLYIHSCVFLSRGVPRTGIEPVCCRQRGIFLLHTFIYSCTTVFSYSLQSGARLYHISKLNLTDLGSRSMLSTHLRMMLSHQTTQHGVSI